VIKKKKISLRMYNKKQKRSLRATMYLPPNSVVRDDQRLVIGNVDYFETRGADVVVRSCPRDALPQCAVSR